MKLIQIHYHFEFSEVIEDVLDRRNVRNFVRYALVEGKDRDGKHYGSKIYPGSSSVIQALVPDEEVGDFLEDLKTFRQAEASHRHLTAVVLPVENALE